MLTPRVAIKSDSVFVGFEWKLESIGIYLLTFPTKSQLTSSQPRWPSQDIVKALPNKTVEVIPGTSVGVSRRTLVPLFLYRVIQPVLRPLGEVLEPRDFALRIFATSDAYNVVAPTPTTMVRDRIEHHDARVAPFI